MSGAPTKEINYMFMIHKPKLLALWIIEWNNLNLNCVVQHTEQYKHLHKYTLHSIIYTCTYNSIYPLYRIHAPLTTYVPTTHSIQYPLPNIPTHTSSHVHMDTHVIPLYTSHPHTPHNMDTCTHSCSLSVLWSSVPSCDRTGSLYEWYPWQRLGAWSL